MLAKAIALASKKHINQKDKAGKPYILHPLRIMANLAISNDQELMTVAILHDVVEDSDVSLSDLYKEGYSHRVVQAIDALTKRKDESYEDLIRRVATNEDARLVKIQDLKDNSDITRLKGISKRDIDRMEKYHRAFLYLSE